MLNGLSPSRAFSAGDGGVFLLLGEIMLETAEGGVYGVFTGRFTARLS